MNRVRVYWNLNKNAWSVMSKRIVISHKDIIVLSNVRFIVSENGRQKVIREKKKNVHAFAEGEIVEADGLSKDLIDEKLLSYKTRQISYNPYKYPCFFERESKEIIFTAGFIVMKDRKIIELLSNK